MDGEHRSLPLTHVAADGSVTSFPLTHGTISLRLDRFLAMERSGRPAVTPSGIFQVHGS